MRTFITVFSFVLLLVAGGMCYQYSLKSDKASKSLNSERYQRLSAEENLQKASERIKSLEAENQRLAGKAENIEKALDQKSIMVDNLNARLDLLKKEKDSLSDQVNILTKRLSRQLAPSTEGL